MPSQHKHPPIAFRPPEGDRLWLLEHAQQTGQPVNRVLALALAAYRAQTGIQATSCSRNPGPRPDDRSTVTR
jgi:hypothetical protein